MKKARLWTSVLILGAAVILVPVAFGQEQEPVAEKPAPTWMPDRPWEVIDVAIALDSSGSMQPLVDTARTKLWEIVNDLTLVEPTPTLRVALLSYGTERNDWKDGWVRIETDFTDDLDQVSERLFELETSSGRGEYLGRVLSMALERLSWTPSEDTLKLIFVAGNEGADQDPGVSFRKMSEAAFEKGVFVHAIFCGKESHPDAALWREMGELTHGSFAAIDHKSGAAVVETPFDQELAKLSTALNETFLPLGEGADERLERLTRQDERAAQMGSAAAATRAQVKASPLYSSRWDLVDALRAETIEPASLEESELPERLRSVAPEERDEYLGEMLARREMLRQQISDLGDRRLEYLASHEKKKVGDTGTFDSAVRNVLRESLEEKGFRTQR